MFICRLYFRVTCLIIIQSRNDNILQKYTTHVRYIITYNQCGIHKGKVSSGLSTSHDNIILDYCTLKWGT